MFQSFSPLIQYLHEFYDLRSGKKSTNWIQPTSSWTPLSLKVGKTGGPETSATSNIRCVTSKKNEYLTYSLVETWNHATQVWFYIHAIVEAHDFDQNDEKRKKQRVVVLKNRCNWIRFHLDHCYEYITYFKRILSIWYLIQQIFLYLKSRLCNYVTT